MSRESEVLLQYKTLVVVGLSSDPMRPSYRVSRYMQEHGYRIIPVNPLESEVLGERCYESLADVPDPIEFVDVFRRSEFCAEIAQAAADRGARVLWLQEGVVSPEAEAVAERSRMTFIEDACVMAVHMREFRD